MKILLDLALNQEKGPVPVGDISLRQGISVKYIDQLMQPLKKSGFINSVRGPKGGYLLAHPPDQITMGQVICAMEGDLDPLECLSQPELCAGSPDCLIRIAWQKGISAMLDELDRILLPTFYTQSKEDLPSSFEPPCGAIWVRAQKGHPG